MVRWPKGLHPQRGGYGSSQLAWLPGWHGSGQQPIRAIPVTSYRNRLSGVPLTGGQAQGVITGYATTSGTKTSPGAFVNIVTVTVAPGTYIVQWSVSLSGTLSSADTNNFALFNGATQVATSVNTDTAGTYPQAQVVVTVLPSNPSITITSIGAGTSGAVYSATLPSASPGLTLQVGPQGLGTIWYPIQVTVSTTTGALDTSTALVYLGPLTTPATLVGTVFTGNGTVALAIPDMTPGQTLIVTWTGGHVGDTAAMNIIGTMDALGT